MKKLYKSRTNKQVSGVCGGLADYFKVDATLIRLAWVIFGCCGGAGLVAYIICAVIVPDEPTNEVIADAE
jgi:phage shock protein C